ncbi:hypothetical protein [Psychrobacter sp. DM4]|uniref:hypothetical protein n=1 Tax=Psychrobacter sp. DM4 TaxID=3440637 RepID=UPI003F50148B
MGIWIAILIVMFVLGSMMALKPSGIDQRLDKLRIEARRMQLNPKLVACPEWMQGRDNEMGRGMIGQYGLVLDNIKMPHTRYKAINGEWRADNSTKDTVVDTSTKLDIPTAVRTSTQMSKTKLPPKIDFSLDKVPLELPPTIEPFVKALITQANSVIIYWEDIDYVRPSTNPAYKSYNIEPDLSVLKTQLEKWALQVQNAQKSASQLPII